MNIVHHLMLKVTISYKAQRFGNRIGPILRPKMQSKCIHFGPTCNVVLKL